jgi:hypothetical protein
VSLEVLNELLALVAHEGSGNEKASHYDKQQMVIKWSPMSTERTAESNKAELKALKDLNEILKEAESTQTGQW